MTVQKLVAIKLGDHETACCESELTSYIKSGWAVVNGKPEKPAAQAAKSKNTRTKSKKRGTK